MPKRQSTAAQKARQRQAATGEKYTAALRAQEPGAVRHRAFSARGAGWDPILRRAEQQLDVLWPGHPAPEWEEKFGALEWKRFQWQAGMLDRYLPGQPSPWTPPADPQAAWLVVREAQRGAARTCQTCPSPGRKRVVWTWDSQYGWVQPWVKTCCDACANVPTHLREDEAYLALVEEYEEPS